MSGRNVSLHGRGLECAALDGVLASVNRGACEVLVLRGEAGAGKSALLRYLMSGAAGFRVLTVAGVQADIELAFAGLHQLCAPLLEQAAGVPEPQRRALDVAFGRDVGDTPDRFLVGLAVLSLLSSAATDQPLLIVVDDAQWLDKVSLQTLAFVARRLLAERIALVFAVREPTAPLAGLPELVVGGLSDAAARDLLQSVMPGGIDPRVRDRVVAETRGLPLAILEVPRSMSAAELSGGFWIAGKRSSPAAVEQTYVRRIRALPAATRQLLLLAAAEPVGDAPLFLRAAARLGVAISELGPAESEGLIEFGPRMRFAHPLMRSAAYRAADLADRRVIHHALAESTDAAIDPDRRAWHRAQAAAGPDDEVAADLEQSAARARSRGGIAAAAAFLERSTVLTADPALRAERALTAAVAKRDAADTDAAYDLLAIAESDSTSELQAATATRLRAQMEFVRSRTGDPDAPRVAETAPLLLETGRRLTHLDDYGARECYLEAVAALIYAGRLAEPAGLDQAGALALDATADPSTAQRPIDLLLRGIAERLTGGPGTGTTALRAALTAMCDQVESDESAVARWLSVPAFPVLQESAAHELWDEDLVRRLAEAAARYTRSAGSLAAMPRALTFRAGVHVVNGDFTAADHLLSEAASIMAATGARGSVRYHSLLLAAWRGDAAAADSLLSGAVHDARVRGEGRLLGLTAYARAVLFNGLGRYEEALTAARDGCRYDDLGFRGWSLYELIEAACHAGDRAAAEDAFELLARSAQGCDTDWAAGALSSARAMLTDDPSAEGHFQRSVEHLSRTSIVVHLARARLAYGEWLRRANRRNDAREQLSAAHRAFDAMGAQGFAERARRELAVAGEKVRRPQPSRTPALTAQETQIAKLAAEGLTNPEIGAQLFLSSHTVEWHLRKVFAKLGITSRRQLRSLPMFR